MLGHMYPSLGLVALRRLSTGRWKGPAQVMFPALKKILGISFDAEPMPVGTSNTNEKGRNFE
jgi:hypothetical protein